MRDVRLSNNRTVTMVLLFSLLMVFGSVSVHAALSADAVEKVEIYKKKLVEWAANPIVVKAVKEANARGPIPGMNNAKWNELSENDPLVLQSQNSEAGKFVKSIELNDKTLAKLYVRAADGYLVAGSSKPLIYDVSTRPTFKAAIAGQVWSADVAKPDPTTQIKAVQVSAPIMDGDKVIGVLHTAVVAE